MKYQRLCNRLLNATYPQASPQKAATETPCSIGRAEAVGSFQILSRTLLRWCCPTRWRGMWH